MPLSLECCTQSWHCMLIAAADSCRCLRSAGFLRPAQKLAEAYKDTTTWVKVYGNSNEKVRPQNTGMQLPE